MFIYDKKTYHLCFNTQPPEGGWDLLGAGVVRQVLVSTHSRPKAAGSHSRLVSGCIGSFNTQPPEGGWGCPFLTDDSTGGVSTHSRPKAAGLTPC